MAKTVAETKNFEVAVLGGDGIGPEVANESVRLLREMQPALSGVEFEFTEYSVGVGEYQRSGNALPTEAFTACEQSDAVLLGAMGLPNVRYPDGKEIAPQLDLRERLGLYGGIRPIRLYNADDTPLKGYEAGEIDFVLLRESTEGLFAGRGATFEPGADRATNEMVITREGAERVSRLAFQLAQKRNKKVSLIDKANVLSSMVFFREIFDAVAKEFPDCEAEHVYVDATALFLVRDPKRFDVMVTENMFGDILSDLAAGLVGGMGMAPSGDVGASAAVFQPSHGSAPDIAGQGIANPTAMILSAAMMLEWFEHPETVRAAEAIHQSVATLFEDRSLRTPDMGGKLSTSELTTELIAVVKDKL
ncbi:MAG: isocitrate/isopropylmalate dehydrogenase family protein [Planctomycetota bacterium]